MMRRVAETSMLLAVSSSLAINATRLEVLASLVVMAAELLQNGKVIFISDLFDYVVYPHLISFLSLNSIYVLRNFPCPLGRGQGKRRMVLSPFHGQAFHRGRGSSTKDEKEP